VKEDQGNSRLVRARMGSSLRSMRTLTNASRYHITMHPGTARYVVRWHVLYNGSLRNARAAQGVALCSLM
jgi:hypothetical protein